MSNFDDFLATVEDGAREIARELLVENSEDLLQGSKAFLEEARADLEKWTLQLAHNEMSPADFEFLVKGKTDLLEVHVHSQIGLGKVALDKFRMRIMDLLISTAFDMFG